MGLIRNAANRKIVGRIGDTTYYISNQRQIARQALNSSNFGETARRTEAQQRRRVKWSNLVNFYKLSKGWMRSAFESKQTKQSDYNRFMSVNVNSSKVALTRTEAVQGACVVEPFIVSQGSLKPIEQTKTASGILTDIVCTLGGITPQTKTSQFAKNLVENNQHIEYMMQLSFISYQQGVTAAGVPFVTLGQYEVTLDPNNDAPVNDYLPPFCTDLQGGGFIAADNLSTGCHSYVLSQRQSTGLKVSTQQLVNINGDLIEHFSSQEQLFKAINSYGLDTEVMLNPNSLADEPYVPVELGIAYAQNLQNSTKYYAGDSVMLGDLFSGSGIGLTMLNELPEGRSIRAIQFKVYGDDTLYSGSVTSVTGADIVIGVQGGSYFESKLRYIEVALDNYETMRIEFSE